ncbi:MAG: hypothetical protein KGO82_00355 [Bacteroidota bacterium]|nr:hypothetical protein [Bacteroidota bacterium]
MKNISQLVLLPLAVCFVVGCGAKQTKKVIVMASGSISASGNTIELDPSLTHNEKELIFEDAKLNLSVKSKGGESKNFELTDNGIYVLNLQTDTLIGGLVNYGSVGVPGSITAEQLDHIIDSTEQLMTGAGASDAKSTFFIPPFTIKKLSSKDNARVIGSFKGIPYKVDVDETGKTPDVIKFFSNKQKRETLKDLMEQRAKLKKV